VAKVFIRGIMLIHMKNRSTVAVFAILICLAIDVSIANAGAIHPRFPDVIDCTSSTSSATALHHYYYLQLYYGSSANTVIYTSVDDDEVTILALGFATSGAYQYGGDTSCDDSIATLTTAGKTINFATSSTITYITSSSTVATSTTVLWPVGDTVLTSFLFLAIFATIIWVIHLVTS